ncbi:MAG TPA: FTR1 family protein [Dehalococcoidia bacterium]|nr:FTR1 family protein [Dehalococcoidia bacterium]
MLFSFLVTLREGVEIALVITILLGYLRSTGQRRHFREIWLGAGVAAAVCLAVGAGLELASRELDSQLVEGFEGFTMLFAVALLTAMAFWMKRQASGISSELRAHVDQALGAGSMATLVLLAASSVGREGLETTLFLFAGSATAGAGLSFVIGGLLGFVLAAFIGVGLYHGSSRMPLKPFFTISGVVVIVLAAGLVSNGVAHLHESGLLSNIGVRPWDTDALIASTSTLGQFLNTLLGYDSAPALSQIVLYWLYLLGVAAAFLWLPAAARPPQRAVQPAISSPGRS